MKKFLIAMIVASVAVLHAQKKPQTLSAEIKFADGITKTFFIILPVKTDAKTIKVSDGQHEGKLDIQDIDRISFTAPDGFDYLYVSMPHSDGGAVKSKKKLMLAGNATGKVKLYVYSWGASPFRPVYKMDALNTPGSEYYCKRNDEPFATLVSLDDGNSVNRNAIFKKRASAYFADDADLVKKIQDKEYTFSDIYAVVRAYNQAHPE
jgi:hypothetical protein